MKIPAFVVAGQPNDGKTTVVSTLTEDDRMKISPIPGSTRMCRGYSMRVDGLDKIIIYDTPGFQNTGAVLEWTREHSREFVNPAQAFIDQPEHREEFPDDCEVLRPIAEGAAVIMVVNPALPVMQDNRYQAEIFRLCGATRVGLLNMRSGTQPRYLDDWTDLLKKEMNTWQKFDACEAVFTDRVELLKVFATATPEWKEQMDEVIVLLEASWRERLAQVAEGVTRRLRSIVRYRTTETSSDGESELLKQRLEKRVCDEVRKIEEDFRSEVCRIFRHSQNHWQGGAELDVDIFSADVWELFGMSKNGLIIASALTGAGAGALIDVATGGTSLGLAALIGGAIGGVSAFMAAGSAVQMELPELRLGPLRIPRKKIGGQSVKAGIQRRSKLPGILLDRMVAYAEDAASWAHGRRGTEPTLSAERRNRSFCSELEQSPHQNEAGKLQALVELWYRTRESSVFIAGDQQQAIQESERWLTNRIERRLRERTMGKG